MPTNGRRKGSENERVVAALLAEWWGELEPEVKFVRTPGSGGWSTAKVRAEFRASGDVMTTSPSFPFTVEAKRRESFSWDNFLAGRRSPVWSWWLQSLREAGEQNAHPMLWLRKNREPWRCVLRDGLVQSLVGAGLLAPRFVVRRGIPDPGGDRVVAVVSAVALLAVPPRKLLDLLATHQR